MKRTQADRIGAPGSLEELQRELAGALVPSSVEELQRQFAAALEQQAATARILEVINTSGGDLQPVYQAVVDAAQRLLLADAAGLYRVAGSELETVALGSGVRVPGLALGDRIPIDPATVAGAAAFERQTVHVPDVRRRPDLPQNAPLARLGVPILHQTDVVGVITVAHADAQPFGSREISLLETFAGQVGIAIENARLMNETQEGFDRQTALAEILRVIAASPSDIQPVLDAIAVNARRFCAAEDVVVHVREGDRLFARAHIGDIPASDLKQFPASIPLDASAVPGHAATEKRTIHVPDIRAGAEYPLSRVISEETGHRATLATPMLRGDEAIGTILLRRLEPRPFSQRQIELVETFAAQAAIAIENVRLFNETKEALEREAASADILEAISRSTNDVAPVLETALSHAVRLCRAQRGAIYLREGDGLRFTAHSGWAPEWYVEELRTRPAFEIGDSSIPGRTAAAGRPVMVEDVLTIDDGFRPIRERAGFRTVLGVPLMRGDEVIGVFSLSNTVLRPFTPAEIELVRTFADQVVVAIENVRLFNETSAALERQTAIAGILKVISSSPTDLQPVLDAIASSARQFCGAEDAFVGIADGDVVSVRAHTGPLGVPQGLFTIDRRTVTTRSMVDRKTIQVDDLQRPEYAAEYPIGHEQAKLTGQRATLATPLLREGKAIGAIMLRRSEPRPFSDRQVELAQTFADQAVIAIENVRLFNETNEALAQQTATADVLKVISRSAFDLDAVFENLLQNAVTICNADWGSIQRADGDGVRNVAQVGGSAAFREVNERTVYRPGRETSNGRALLEKRPIHIHDLAADPEYKFTAAVELGGIRTNLVVPMLRDDKVVGTFGLSRNEVRPFSEKEIALVSTFADQAAIAIENVRLFNETKEALEQQTATAEILRVIAKSPTDVQPVLDAITKSAATFCASEDATVGLLDGSMWSIRSHYGPVEINVEHWDTGSGSRTAQRPLSNDFVSGHAMIERRTVHVSDLQSEEARARYPTALLASPTARAIVATPLLRSGEPIGALFLRRREPIPFTERQIQLVETFADQAVIAIENVRLFNETNEALERQTATSEVLRSISGSAFEVNPVFETILEQSFRLCDAEDAMVVRAGDGGIRVAAHRGPVDIDVDRLYPMTRGLIAARAVIDDATVHVTDMLAEPAEYPESYELATAYGFRSTLAVPLRRQGKAIGAILIRRQGVQPFRPDQVRLLETFADQAVIAVENVRLFNETREALERQTAISEILRVISESPTNVQPVLDAIAQSAARFCGAEDVLVMLEREGELRATAHSGQIPLPPDMSYPIDRRSMTGRAFVDGVTLQVPDMLTSDVAASYPLGHALARQYGWRTAAIAPLLREGRAIGTVNLRRVDVRPFTDKQLDLLQTFASQAVIAIENVRLFNETKEALERQTAVAGILRAISESPTDVQPVLETIAESAARFCGAEDATLLMVDGEMLRTRAHHGPVPIRTQLAMEFPLTRGTVTGRSILERRTVHVPDLQAETDDEYPIGKEQARRMGHRTTLATPLLREGVGIGAILLRRMEARPFTDHQLDLVRTFADQAVIAIENVRLFNETRESLERQTAIAEVMKAIGSSMSESQRAVDQVVSQATRLAEADNGFVYQVEGEYLRLAAAFGDKADAMREWQRTNPIKTQDLGSATGRAFSEARTIHIEDVLADPTYTYHQAQQLGGFRVLLAVPMIAEGRPLGVLALWRVQPRPFSDAHIKVVELFADQAVVAMENVRLFNETREALEQQTATAEVLKTISRSAFDLRPVFETIVESSRRLCEADLAWLNLTTGKVARAVAFSGDLPRGMTLEDLASPGTADYSQPQVIQTDDAQLSGWAIAKQVGARSTARARMFRGKEHVGTIAVARSVIRPFTEKQLELIETFADQAAIAIENVRLFNEIQDKSKQLEVASRHKSEFLANMSHELRTPLNAIIGFTDVMLEEMFGPLNEKQKEYLEDVRNSGTHLLTLINDILDLSKVEAGRIELEIAEFSFPEALDNAMTLVRERATRHGITLAADMASDVGRITADERKVKQVLVNLLANAVKFTPDGGRVTVSARRLNGEIEVAVHDTGIGVATEDQERIFDEFQQVGRDPERSREGTGLGLTLAKRFVELHGGRIWVESEVGKGSTFTFAIPVRQTALADAKA